MGPRLHGGLHRRGVDESEVENLIEFVEPSAVLVDEVASGHKSMCRFFDLQPPLLDNAQFPVPTSDLDRPALVLFTSGTTGDTKRRGLELSRLAEPHRAQQDRDGIGQPDENALVTLPTSFGHGLIGNALTPLLSGGDIVLHPLGLPLAQNLGTIIDRYRIGFLSSVPAFWRMALKFSNAPAEATLARVHVGSAPLSADLWAKIAEWTRADVVNCYGVTELANWVAGASSRIDGIADGMVGKPWGGVAAVKDSAGRHSSGRSTESCWCVRQA